MIREVVKPYEKSITVSIPNEYRDKYVEILILPIANDEEYVADIYKSANKQKTVEIAKSEPIADFSKTMEDIPLKIDSDEPNIPKEQPLELKNEDVLSEQILPLADEPIVSEQPIELKNDDILSEQILPLADEVITNEQPLELKSDDLLSEQILPLADEPIKEPLKLKDEILPVKPTIPQSDVAVEKPTTKEQSLKIDDDLADEFLAINQPQEITPVKVDSISEAKDEVLEIATQKIVNEPVVKQEPEIVQKAEPVKEPPVVVAQEPKIVDEVVEEYDDDANPINRILVAEDNDINQKLISKMLNSFGINPVIVSNGLMAVQKRQTEDFDMIFMDIAMPVMDGVQAIKNILKYERDNNITHIPIVAVTANALKGDRERFMAEGADEYVTKPVKRDNISNILKMFSSKSNIEKICKRNIMGEESSSQEQSADHAQTQPVAKVETLPHIDIMIFRKSSMETFMTKSIIGQINNSCDSCENLEELCDKLKNTHYSLIMFDYEITNLDPVKLSQCVKEAEKNHNRGKINTVILADERSDMPAKINSLFTQVSKGIMSREKIIKLIGTYVRFVV